MNFLYQHLKEGSFRTAYADTDRKGFNMVPISVPAWYL